MTSETEATVREIVKDKLKLNAPGLSECTRTAIARSIAMSASAALASTAGAGDWVTVPRTATKAMLDAAYTAHDAYEAAPEPKGWGGLGSVYKAMIEAAPAVPASPRSGEPLSQGGGEGRSEKGEGEDLDRLRYLAQSRYELLRECQSEFRALGCKGLVETIETALSHPLAKRAAPAQSPNTSDREG